MTAHRTTRLKNDDNNVVIACIEGFEQNSFVNHSLNKGAYFNHTMQTHDWLQTHSALTVTRGGRLSLRKNRRNAPST